MAWEPSESEQGFIEKNLQPPRYLMVKHNAGSNKCISYRRRVSYSPQHPDRLWVDVSSLVLTFIVTDREEKSLSDLAP